MLILARSAQTFLVKVVISAIAWLSVLIAVPVLKIWA